MIKIQVVNPEIIYTINIKWPKWVVFIYLEYIYIYTHTHKEKEAMNLRESRG